MSRCFICDFIEGGEGINSAAPFIPRSRHNKVKWNKLHQGFLCLDCQESITLTNKVLDHTHQITELDTDEQLGAHTPAVPVREE